MYLALAHYLLDQYEQSYAVLAKMRAGTFEYRNLLGAVSARVDRWQDAKDQLQLAIQEAPDRAEGYLNLGLLCLERGDDAAAAELFDQGAARLRPGAKVHYRIRTRPNCAGLIPPDPGRKPDRDRAKSYTTFALALQKAQHWQSALEVYLLALKSDPRAIQAYGGVGLVCQELGTPDVGKVFLERGLELSPGDAELYYYLGSVMEALGSPGEAQGRYEKAVRLREPEVPAAYLVRLGSVQLLAGREADAEASFRRAIRRDPDHARAHHELGKLYLKRRQYRLAEESLGLAVRLDPLLSEAQYAYGLACLRNGKAAAGKVQLENHRRKKELRTTVGVGTLPVNPQ
jgi:tetratricopeptide (TPR) repeat protein